MTKAFKYFLPIIPLIYGHYAFAQSVDVPALQTVPLPAEQIILVIPEQCQLLPPHIPDDNVNYKPGKDVMGRDVVPADIAGGANAFGLGQNGYSFYMIHDALKGSNAAEKFGLTGSQEGRIILGQITVRDGDVLWNGNSLREADRNSIYMLCNAERRGKKRPIVKR